MLGADADQIEQSGMHGDEIDAKRPCSKRLGRGNFSIEQCGRHCPAGNHPKSAGIADRSNQPAFGNPRHRAAQNRMFTAKKRRAALHQGGTAGVGCHAEIPLVLAFSP